VARGGPQYHRSWPDDPEVGWGGRPGVVGPGIATELGSACVGWVLGPLGFPRAVSITTEANVASRRVMAKLGFSLLTKVHDP
jgi:RimJ/RimL family protein N-acetyltransferase